MILERDQVVVDQMDHARQKRQNPSSPEEMDEEHLSDEERLVIASICMGMKNRQIAGLLGVGERVVEQQVASICRKLSSGDRLELIIQAFRYGLAPQHRP